MRTGGVRVDAADACVSVWTPHERRVEGSRHLDVVGEDPAARQETRIFLPTHAGTEDPLDVVCCVSTCGALVAGGRRGGRGHGRRSSAWFAAGHLDLGAGR